MRSICQDSSLCFEYKKRSCRRFGLPCQNSKVFGIILYPPQKSGSGISPSENLCFISSSFISKILLDEITELWAENHSPIFVLPAAALPHFCQGQTAERPLHRRRRLERLGWLSWRTSPGQDSQYRSARSEGRAVRAGLLFGAFMQPLANGDDDRIAVLDHRSVSYTHLRAHET